MRFKYILLLVFASLLFVSCASNNPEPEIRVITEKKLVKLDIPISLVKFIRKPIPPDKQKLLKMHPLEVQVVLGKYIVNLLGAIDNHNEDIEKFHKWYKTVDKLMLEEQEKLYKTRKD